MATAKANKNDNNDKVFDVTKPGKTAASASSRPLIIGHKSILKDPMVKESAVDDLEVDKSVKIEQLVPDSDKPSGSPPLPDPEVEAEAEKTKAPSESKLVIKPLSSSPSKTDKPKNKEENSNKVVVSVKSKSADKPAAAVVAAEALSTEAEPAEDKADDDTTEETPADETEDSANTEDERSEAVANEGKTDGSEDVVADTSAALVAQRKAEKEAEAAAAKDTQLEKMVSSKQYYAPIGEKTRKRRSLKHVFLGALLIILLGGALLYLMIDVGIIKTSYKLPYHFFKQTDSTTSAPTTISPTPPSKTNTTSTYKVPTGYVVYENKELGFKFAYPKDYDPISIGAKPANTSVNWVSQYTSAVPKSAYAPGVTGSIVLTVYNSTATISTYKYGPQVKFQNGKLLVVSVNPADTVNQVGSEFKNLDKVSAGPTANGSLKIYIADSGDESGSARTFIFVSKNQIITLGLPTFNDGKASGKTNDSQKYNSLSTNILNSIQSL
jgi:chemotaxis protein histidine kinase CheA